MPLPAEWYAQASLEGTSTPSRRSDVRVPVLALSLAAALQAVVILMTGADIVTRIVAVALALAGLVVRLRILSALAVLIVANFVLNLVRLRPPYPYRLADVFILAVYGALALAWLIACVSKIRFGAAFAATSAMAIALVAAELAIERVLPPSVVSPMQVLWIGGPQPDPVFGETYQPYAVLQTVYQDNPRGYFESTSQAGSPSHTAYSVTYSLNALGCRGRDYTIPRAHGRHRILVLGNSSTFGVGVREPDTFPARLERSLNTTSLPTDRGYDVINCGTPGYGTRVQRLLYEQVLFRYEPDVVLLSMTERDNLSRRDEIHLGYVRERARYESLLLSTRLIQYTRHEGRRPFEYSSTLADLADLIDACRTRGARLTVVLFGSQDLSPHWSYFVQTVTGRLKEAGVPVLDLGPALLREHTARELMTHPLDASPNEIAHGIASVEIEHFLRGALVLNLVR